MIFSIDSEEDFDKMKRSFIIKILERVGQEGTYLKTIKTIYGKATGNIILNGEKLEAINLFEVRSRVGNRAAHSPLPFNMVFKHSRMKLKKYK